MLFTIGDGKRALRIFFREPAPNTSYVATARPDWNTKVSINNKKQYGFVIRFKDPAPPEGGVISVEVPGFQIYTAAQMVREENQRNREAWRRLTSNQASQVAREMEARLAEVRRRADLRVVQENTRIYTCDYCSQQGVGLEWARSHHHATVQTPLITPVVQRQRAKKKKPVKDARLNALINATVGG